jgi:hypothetical protein
MKKLTLWMICPWLLTTGALSSCAGMPIKFSASYDIQAEGMEKPIRVEVGYWNVKMAGKETREVQP